jgi:dTDP-glucose 4,6-dehydratase
MGASLPPPSADVVVVTGGCGFIGSNFLVDLAPRFPATRFVNLDSHTYAANPLSLKPLEGAENFVDERLDLRDASAVAEAIERHRPGLVVHFAAESHVDRSVLNPRLFVETNVMGTFNVLDSCRLLWAGDVKTRFHHVSTDEVFGSLGGDGQFFETTAYSASKAGSDHLVRAYFHTYGMPVSLTNCSNNYGPRQHPEKLLPLMIANAVGRKTLPVYGDGGNIRDWLFVTDHVRAIWQVAHDGRRGETYNVGGDEERTNLEVLGLLLDVIAERTATDRSELQELIRFVKDRPGHDRRYAVNFDKLKAELGWRPDHDLRTGIGETVDWYLANQDWVEEARARGHDDWVRLQYVQAGRA